jgi:hypothetical protein
VRPSKNRFEHALSGKRAAAIAAFAALFAVVYFAKRGQDAKPEPSKDIAAANLPAQPQSPPPTVAAEPAASNPKSDSEAITAPPSEPPKVPKESSPTEKAAAHKTITNPTTCTLNLNTIPASRVTLDGRELGMTPQLGISVQPGSHIVMFANEGGKKVTPAPCKAGEQKTVVLRLPI